MDRDRGGQGGRRNREPVMFDQLAEKSDADEGK
jgi:hypothetical protein